MTSVIRRVGFSISLAALGLLWGCSHGGNSSGGGASLAPTSSATTTGTTPTTSTTTTAPFSTVSPVARLYADVNRDGVIDGNDDAGRDTWTSSRGAIFVYNNDDDDGKHAIDCSDSIINGPMDPRTDTVIVAGQYTGGTPQSVTLSIAPATAPVRIFLRDANGNYGEFLSPGSLSGNINVSQITQQPVTMLLEGTGPRATGWDGTITVTLTINDTQTTTDTLMLREAPLIYTDNTRPAVRVYAMDITDPSSSPNQPFWTVLSSGLLQQNVPLQNVDQNTYQFDRWVQDGMQLGYNAYVGPNGYTWIDDFNQLERSPNQGGLWDLVPNELLSHNQGETYAGSSQVQDSPNYGGNLEVFPPHTDPTGVVWPFGRIYHGGGDAGSIGGSQYSRHMNPEEVALLEAQGMQSPTIEISTEWLDVGHVDEISMVVNDPNKTNGRPWKLLWSSPTLGIQALTNLNNAGHGSATVFTGQTEQTTVSAILGNATLMQFNQGVQARMDSNKQILMNALGLQASDFIEVPVVYTTISNGGVDYGVAYNPGVQNCIPVNDTLYVPDPYGPTDPATGKDVWQTQVVNAVQPLGLTVVFVDVYTSYHQLEGEAHCGSNVRYQPYDMPWWSK